MKLQHMFGAVLLALALSLAGSPAQADTMAVTRAGTLEISGAFARATLPGARTGGGYLTITNTGSSDDRLLAVSAPFASMSQLHSSAMNGSVMQMRPATGGIAIPAGQTVKLTPSGLHVMFMGLSGPLKQGSTVPVTLSFEKAGEVAVTLDVLGIAASDPMAGMAM